MRCSTPVVAIAALAWTLIPATGEAQTPEAPRCGSGVHESEALGAVAFPQDQIFCPTIADPKEARSFVGLQRGTFPSLDDPSGKGTTIASVGLGDNFGLVRWGGPAPNEGVQLDVTGSIFAQFDLGAPSNDLINADYLIGLPLTFRRSGFSTRIRILPSELAPRRRVSAPKRGHRTRESLVRVARNSRLSGNRGASSVWRGRADFPT